MSAFTVYDAATGEIRWTGTCPASMVAAQASEPGTAVVEAPADDATQYVDLATLTVADRQAMTPAHTITTGQIEITGLPAPCTVSVAGTETEVLDGEATITFDEPGDYTLSITARPQYLDHTLEVSIP